MEIFHHHNYMTTTKHPGGNTTHKASKIVNGKSYEITVTEYQTGEFRGVVTARALHPVTGYPWQAKRLLFSAEGENSPAEALAFYLKVGQ